MTRAGRSAMLDSRIFDPVSSFALRPTVFGRVVASGALLVEAEGLDRPLGCAVRVHRDPAAPLDGEIIGFEGGRSKIAPLAPCDAIQLGARVEVVRSVETVACSDSLLGRVVDARGVPLDGTGIVVGSAQWPLSGPGTNPMDRDRVRTPFATGVRAIDALLTAGSGQRIAIVAAPGVGKTVLTNQILGGADCDVAVVALIGERSREISDFVETRRASASWKRTCVVAVPADHPPLLRIRAALRATAIAEYFRSKGQNVLLVVDSLTRVAHAQREIGLALGEPPTLRGYPPSVFALIPRLVERAGGDRRSGGAITAIYTVLADSDDADDPVAETVRSISDGHIVLSRKLAEQGVFPAIDIGRSLSRVMADVTDGPHQAAARRFRALWGAYHENRDLALMGALVPGSDPLVDEAMARHRELADFVRQPVGEDAAFDRARAALVAGFSS